MAGFDSIIDQKRPIRILSTFLEKTVIPHALLFSGIDGVGKAAAALTLAKACNCSSGPFVQKIPPHDPGAISSGVPAAIEPCETCRSCRLIQAGNHPDVIRIKPQGRQIRIEQIRSLYDSLALKPYEALMRFVIIRQADLMNRSAGNALLKILEEPPDKTIIILTAVQPANLLPTIVSRCQHIRFNPLSRHSIQKVLINREAVAEDQAAVIAALANGSLDKATALSRSDWTSRRNWLLMASGLDQPQKLSTRPVRFLLSFAGQLAEDKQLLEESLATLAAWLRDLMIFQYLPERVINVDLIDKIQYTASKNTTRDLIAKLDIVLAAQNELSRNTNTRLNLEQMMLKLARS